MGARRVGRYFFGELAGMDQMVSDMKRTATVRNLTDIAVAAMDADDFKKLCVANPEIISAIDKFYRDRQEQLAQLRERIKNI